MNRAATYYRYSSDKQTEDSIEAQRRACTAYAAAHGLEIVAEYVDEAISGKGAKTASRAAYQRMLRDCDKGMFDTILIHKYDRVARSIVEHVNLEVRLKNRGITLTAVAQDFGQSNEAVIMRTMVYSLSEYYLLNLAQETRKGHQENALKALHNGGKPAFGYDVADGKYVVNDIEAEYVRKIFDAALNCRGFNDVIAEMEAAGIKSKYGRPIKYTAIHDMLRNEKYVGTYVYSPVRARTRDDRRKKPGAIRVEDAVPAIVSKEIFMEVQRIMDERKQTGRGRSHYLCSGLVYCECGKKMHAHKTKVRGDEYLYYECSSDRSDGCSAPSVRMEAVDAAVLEYLHELLDVDNQARIAAALRDYQSKTSDTAADFMLAVDRQIAAKERDYDGLMQNISKASLPPAIVEDMGNRMQELKDEIAALREVEPVTDYTPDQIKAWLESLKNAPDEKAVHLLIERIDVKNKMDFNMTSTLKSILGKDGAGDRDRTGTRN